jgi:hypothetical protein
MTEDDRRVRTERLLAAQLDALARTAVGLPPSEAARLVELASVATMRAVSLDLLRADRADEIWRDAHVRHPELPEIEVDPALRLAA